MMEPMLKKKSMFNRIFKRQFFVTICTIFLLVFILIGSSYALLNAKTETGLTDVVVQSGNLLATISSDSEIIQMNYTTLGVSDEVGLSYDPYTFTVSNEGENKILYYEIRIVDKEYEISTLPHKSLNYALSVNGSDYTNPQNLGDNRSYIYVGGSLDVGESDTFKLKLWVNEEFGKYANNKVLKAAIELTLYSDIPTRNYIIYDSQGGSYIPKTNIVSKRISMQKPIKAGYSFIGWSSTPTGNVEYEANAIYNGNNGMTLYAKYEEATITYNLNGGIGEIPSNKSSQGITTIVPTKDGYVFKGWSIKENGEVVYQSGDTYSGNSITLYAVWGEPPTLYETLETTLASNLRIFSQGVAGDRRYVIGDVDNNYIWYSGKLWRVVSLKDDGTIEMITQNNITNVQFDASTSLIDTGYDVSQVRDWLNNIFLPTLNDSLIIVNDWYDYGDVVDRGLVGLISHRAFLNSLKDDKTYLNNGYRWMTIGKDEIDYENQRVSNGNPESGVRPMICLKTQIKISSGDGTRNKPYILQGDDFGLPGENLNNRLSGEYINFNNTLYRIIKSETIDNQLITKVTMADYSINNNTIGSSSYGGPSFSTEITIGKFLLDWYGSGAINSDYKRMIVNEGIMWDATLDNVDFKYTYAFNNKTIVSPIGLPYYGEIFASQFGEGYDSSVSIYMIGSVFNALPLYITNEGILVLVEDTSVIAGVRPNFYLKSNVKIVSGTGLPNDPYEIVMD